MLDIRKPQFAAAILGAFALAVVLACAMNWRERGWGALQRPDRAVLAMARNLVEVRVSPSFDFSFAYMRPGVRQHLDRRYTYDRVPPELLGGILFQGIHRPPAGTVVEFTLRRPAMVFVFFHAETDGGYGKIFDALDGWHRSARTPQYDVAHGTHGLKMVMYQRSMTPGRYQIPATTRDRGCFSIVFQEQDSSRPGA